MYIVVIRQEGSNGPGIVFTAKTIRSVREKLDRRIRQRSQCHPWSRECVEYIRKNYLVMPASEIAKVLTFRTRRRVTKNMVIGKARRMNMRKKMT